MIHIPVELSQPSIEQCPRHSHLYPVKPFLHVLQYPFDILQPEMSHPIGHSVEQFAEKYPVVHPMHAPVFLSQRVWSQFSGQRLLHLSPKNPDLHDTQCPIVLSHRSAQFSGHLSRQSLPYQPTSQELQRPLLSQPSLESVN